MSPEFRSATRTAVWLSLLVSGTASLSADPQSLGGPSRRSTFKIRA